MKTLMLSLILFCTCFSYADEAILNSSEDLTDSLTESPPTIINHKAKREKITLVVGLQTLEIKNLEDIQDKINHKQLMK